MDEHDRLAEAFESHRKHLQAVAYRMLGSATEAEDTVQEAWLRLRRADTNSIDNLEAWLRTVVSRLCLDMLRTRRSRGEEPIESHAPAHASERDPEQELVLIDEVGRAMLVVLNTLTPAERIAFVLHDLFAVSFGQIAHIVDRTPAAAKKLASRARHRVRGAPTVPRTELTRQRHIVQAFLTAARDGGLDAILSVLAPDVTRRTDREALLPGREPVIRGADAVAKEIVAFGHSARFAALALVNGAVGIVVAPHGQLMLALAVTVKGDRVAEYDVIAAPSRLRRTELAVLQS
jgi:RNA polymerase sigma factor (sigma-70 family)